MTSPSITPPCSGSWRTETSPTSSPFSLRIETRLTGAPIEPKHIENGGARRIEAHVVNHDIRFRKHQRRRQKKHSGRKIAGNSERAPLQARPSMNADRAALAIDARAKFGEREFRVVARAHRLGHGRHALRKQSREQDRGLHLRAGHGQRVLDG